MLSETLKLVRMSDLHDFSLLGYAPDVPLSPVTIGELPPAVCESALQAFSEVHFNLDTAYPRCSLDQLDPRLVEVADKLMQLCPFKVNCAYRSYEWDKSKGRDGKSSHCKGLAMDIATPNHIVRLKLVGHLISLGVKRIGIAKTFIHFDVDPDKMPSLWLYSPDNVNKTF